MKPLALALAVVLLAGPAGAQPLPAALRAVTDEAGVLSTGEHARLSRTLQDLFEKTGVRVLMVIAGTAGPEGMEGYAQRLARRWREERRIDPARAVFVIVAIRDRQVQVFPGRSLGLAEALYRDDPTREPVSGMFAEGRYYDGLALLAGRLCGTIAAHLPGPRGR